MPQKSFDRFTLVLFLLGVLFGGSIGGALGFAVGRSTAPPGLKQSNTEGSSGLVKVVRVIDGDTIEVEGGEKVRYLGVDTPESTTKKECFGKEAAARNRELVEGKMVRLEKDRRDREKYGRALRFVYIGETLVNIELVREGYARVYVLEKSMSHVDDFLKAENEAQEKGLGLWGACPIGGKAVKKH